MFADKWCTHLKDDCKGRLVGNLLGKDPEYGVTTLGLPFGGGGGGIGQDWRGRERELVVHLQRREGAHSC